MILIPSVDILEGKTVRLYKGQFDQVTFYDKNPLDLVKSYVDNGYTHIHIVNLDRAKGNLNTKTEKLIEQICAVNKTKIQMGGGLRSAEHFQQANDLGVYRFVVGTLAIKDIPTTKHLAEIYGKDRLTFAFDVQKENKEFIIKTHGWTESSTYTLNKILEEYRSEALHVLCTDIDKDGALSSPNFDLYAGIKSQHPHIRLQASGGVQNEQDLYELASRHIDAVVVGKAIHENKIDLKKLNANFCN